MDPNLLFLIIIAVLLICFFAGRRTGLIGALIPVATAFLSFWLLAIVIPVLKNDIFEDMSGFRVNEALLDLITFAVSFVLFRKLIRAVLKFFRIIGDTPVISSLNRFLGGVAGFIGGIIIVWGVFFFMLLFFGPEGSPEFFAAVNGNEFVKLLYNNNLILTFVNYLVFT